MRLSLARWLRGIAQRLDPQPVLEDYEDWDWTGGRRPEESGPPHAPPDPPLFTFDRSEGGFPSDFEKPYVCERDDGR